MKITSEWGTDKEARAGDASAALDRGRQLRHPRLVETRCAQCGAAMICQPEGGCWCAELTHVPMPADAEGCLCRTCLRAKIESLQNCEKRKET